MSGKSQEGEKADKKLVNWQTNKIIPIMLVSHREQCLICSSTKWHFCSWYIASD